MPEFLNHWTMQDGVGAAILGAIALLVAGSGPVKAGFSRVMRHVRSTPKINLEGATLVEIISRLEDRREVLLVEIDARELELSEIDKMLGVRSD